MGLFGDVFGGLGDVAGLFSSGGADDDANSFYRGLVDKYGKINPTIAAQQANPSDQSAAQDAIRELQQTYRSGGLDSISRSQIAEANDSSNRNAAANRNAVLGNARARGTGGSGVTAALQEMGGQEAAQDANLASSRAAAGAQANRMGAIGGAASLGIQSATAQDAINRFNASMRQGAQQQTFGNKMDQLGGEGAAYGHAWDAGKAGEARTSKLYSSIGKMAGTAGDSFASGGGGYPSWMSESPLGGASYT